MCTTAIKIAGNSQEVQFCGLYVCTCSWTLSLQECMYIWLTTHFYHWELWGNNSERHSKNKQHKHTVNAQIHLMSQHIHEKPQWGELWGEKSHGNMKASLGLTQINGNNVLRGPGKLLRAIPGCAKVISEAKGGEVSVHTSVRQWGEYRVLASMYNIIIHVYVYYVYYV